MPFQIKDFKSIVAGEINYARSTNSGLTDFNIGSIIRTLLESPSVEIEELYLQMLNGLVDSIPVAIYQAFQFDRLPAVHAQGELTLSRDTPADADITIPVGTVFLVPGTTKRYESIESATLATGETSVEVKVKAETIGTAGNTLANTVTASQSVIAGIDSITNLKALTSGRDIETDAERKIRFSEFISALSRGTLLSIEFGAKTANIKDSLGNITEFVDRAGIVEQVPGRVALYIYNGAGDTSDALVTKTQKIIDGFTDDNGNKVAGYRAGGVKVEVLKMSEQPVNLTATVNPLPGHSVNAAMITALTLAFANYLATINPGETLFTSQLIVRLLSVEGVASIDMTEPAANIETTADVVLVTGVVAIS